MITVNSLSGGKTSSLMAVRYKSDYDVFSLVCIKDRLCAPKDPSIIKYVNDKLGDRYISQYGEFIATYEDDLTLYAMRDLEQHIGRNITWIRGMDFEDLIDNTGRTMLPNKHFRYCTEELKIRAMFTWWFENIGEKVKMNIGFRYDEFNRIESFLNNNHAGEYKTPVRCSTRGKRLQTHEIFDWRFCSFPLAKDGTTKEMVGDYWQSTFIGIDNLFDRRRRIEFPIDSNCVGCPHKKPDTLCIQWNINTPKMEWGKRQEQKLMGTWLKDVTFEQLKEHAFNTPYIGEMIRVGASCDSGGCTD